jgi:DnaK suppressor protein
VDAATEDRLRRVLEEEREALRSQLVDHGADPDSDAVPGVHFDHGFADSAQATAERARLLSLIEGLRQNLTDVERALEKLRAGGGYGLCERCGKEIGPDRLEALPWARLCIECKQRVG